ncbi:hypothetical protein JOB18_027144 [Solea senegalensis]|uniref:Uncharacterized protein n=1 Tax=Solea senegalensis TaxID=28829 RepID=A0AAV6SMI6_SOLSE|nr:hypothetical protein JOB18_027144 [Solea senegalensis]
MTGFSPAHTSGVGWEESERLRGDTTDRNPAYNGAGRVWSRQISRADRGLLSGSPGGGIDKTLWAE